MISKIISSPTFVESRDMITALKMRNVNVNSITNQMSNVNVRRNIQTRINRLTGGNINRLSGGHINRISGGHTNRITRKTIRTRRVLSNMMH